MTDQEERLRRLSRLVYAMLLVRLKVRHFELLDDDDL